MNEALISAPTFQFPRFWLNTLAPLNISPIMATLAVFQVPMFWLNAVALLNIPFIEVTLAVFQLPMFWLNALAPRNICCISVTPERSGLSLACPARLEQPSKAPFIEVH